MQYFIVDAFTEQLFKGNPAAVVILEKSISDERLQAIAAEFNLAETAFLQNQEANRWALRWFSPTIEVDLCGHATLASSHALWNELQQDKATLKFDTLSGELRANLVDGNIALDFPAIPYQITDIDPALLSALKLDPVAVVKTSRGGLFIEVKDEETVRHYQPDFSIIAKLNYRSLTITTKANSGIDFVSRMFAPKIGIPEDSVTGSIHCTLVLYWAEKLGKRSLLAYQASKRGGYLSLTLDNDRVILAGKAVTIMQGQLKL